MCLHVLRTQPVEPINIPISEIKVINRLRKVDQAKVNDIAQSIKEIDLLHPIQVAKKDNSYILLSGNHRLNAMQLLERTTIPSVVRDADNTINQLIEIEENLCSKRLNAIEEAEHIVLREQLLIKLGRKAVVGSNQYTGESITNAELANQLGISRRIYSYKKQVNNITPKAKRLLKDSKFSEKMMDMVRLSKLPSALQVEVAKILVNEGAKTYNRAVILANLKFKKKDWKEEHKKIRDELQEPKSIMRFSRKKGILNDLSMLVSHNENLRKTKRKSSIGVGEVSNYTMLPEHSRWFIKYFTNEGDLICDNTCGRGTNLIAAALEGRRIIGFDLSADNIESIRNVVEDHIGLAPTQFNLHQSCGVEMEEYRSKSNMIDCIINDVPYILGAEDYETKDERDLCYIKDLESYYKKIDIMMGNMKRLIKPSNYEEKIFHPIIMKIGSQRKGDKGLITMDTDIEMIARKHSLILHDKIINELKPTLQNYNVQRCIENKYTIKLMETNLVFLKYENKS